MRLVERRQHALDPSAIACPAGHPRRKRAAMAVAAPRTRFEHHTMFGHLQLQGREVKDLPALWVRLADHVRQRCTTGPTLLRGMDERLIRDGHLLQRCAWMARLASGLSARGLTQRARLFRKTVTGRWLAAVAALGRQPVFQLFDPCRQCGNLRAQRLNQGDDRLWALVVDSSYLFMGQHSVTVPKLVCLVSL